MYVKKRTLRCQQHFGILDYIAVALFGQEKLAIGGKFLVTSVAGYDRVEVCQAPIALGTENASQALSFFLPRTKGARNLNSNIRVRQVNGKICHFADHQSLEFTPPELVIQFFALPVSSFSGQ